MDPAIAEAFRKLNARFDRIETRLVGIEKRMVNKSGFHTAVNRAGFPGGSNS